MTKRSYIKVGRRAEFEGRYTSRLNPSDGSVGGDGGDINLSGYVTTEEFEADQKRQDALIDAIDARLIQVEHALFPFVEFRDEYRECKFKGGGAIGNDYISIIQYWDTSGAGSWTWAWMVEFDGSDVWTDVDDLDASTAASIGYDGSEAGTWLHLFPPVPDDLPDIKIRLDITDELEGFPKAEGSSDPFLPRDVWINKTTSFSTRQKQLPIKKGKKLWLTTDLQ